MDSRIFRNKDGFFEVNLGNGRGIVGFRYDAVLREFKKYEEEIKKEL